MSGSAQFDTPHSRLLLPATLTWGDTKKKMVTLKAFVDSGAADIFLDIELAKNLCIPYETCPSPWKVEALDGRPIGSGMIKFRTVPLHLTIENDHSETISFYLIESSKEPLILGYPGCGFTILSFLGPQELCSAGDLRVRTPVPLLLPVWLGVKKFWQQLKR